MSGRFCRYFRENKILTGSILRQVRKFLISSTVDWVTPDVEPVDRSSRLFRMTTEPKSKNVNKILIKLLFEFEVPLPLPHSYIKYEFHSEVVVLVHFDKRFRDKYSFAGIGIWTHNLLSPLRREHKQV